MTKSNMPRGRRGPAFGAYRGRSGSRGRIFGIPAGLSLGATFYICYICFSDNGVIPIVPPFSLTFVKFIYHHELILTHQGGIDILHKKIEKSIVLTSIVCCLMLSCASPQVISGQKNAGSSQHSYQLSFTVTFSINDFSFNKLLGYDTIQLSNGASTNELGKPMMPMKNIRVALPANMKVTSIQVLDVQEQPFYGTYTMYPAQRPLPVDVIAGENQFIQPDDQTYSSDQPYPASLIELNGQSDLAGQVMADITIFPMHYMPVEKQLTLVTSLTVGISGNQCYVCGDYLPGHISDYDRAMYQQMVNNMVINPQNTVLRASPNPQPMGVGPGNYEYVIITQDSWVSAFQPLADWKTQKGVPATIVTTNWIYNNGGYSGSNVDKIRAFVQDAYSTWGTIYVLLGGDTDTIPCHFKSFPYVDSDPVANDAYYADFDNDWICEVNVGRASVTGPGNGTGQIGNFINKVLTYETNPPLTNYATNAGFFGFDLDYYTHGEQCKKNINNAYIPANWNVTTVYDSQSGNHLTNVINALNAGQNIVNHADHSGNDCMGTGYINHGWLIYSSDMDALTNGNKQTILYSMGCDPAGYDSSNCIGEHFVRNSNGGGIAFMGNSRYGWFMSGSDDTYSLGYDVHFFKSLFQGNFYNLGAAFSDHKDSGYQDNPGDEYYQYIFTELTLLGDPELPVWTENPMILTVTHPSELPVGTSSFTVSVTSAGNPVSQAYVCLWKGTEVYLTGSTDSNGAITFNVTPASPGTLSVTVTKHNYLPNEGSVTIMNQRPNLTIGPITGRLLGVSTEIKNIGNASASHIMWNININGGLILSGKTTNGTFTTLDVNTTHIIKDVPIIGIGAITVTITVSADGIPEMTKTANGFVFVFFVKMS